jgi:transcriptional regulator with XRE-family HTH domain
MIILPENSSIGLRIRKRRADFGFSLRDLAKKADLTASFISQIERGITSPSLNSLRRIAEALEVPLLYFMTDTTKRSPVVRKDARPHLDFDESAVSYKLLTPDMSHKMEVIEGSLEAGTGNIVRKLSIPTEEFILVLSGVLAVCVNDERHILNPGDCIYFEGEQLTEISCESAEKVSWISVITPPVF